MAGSRKADSKSSYSKVTILTRSTLCSSLHKITIPCPLSRVQDMIGRALQSVKKIGPYNNVVYAIQVGRQNDDSFRRGTTVVARDGLSCSPKIHSATNLDWTTLNKRMTVRQEQVD
jgi:hypothetical protein